MRKGLKWIGIAVLFGMVLYMGSVVRDKQQLGNEVLRLHVVANSDAADDQAVKLMVKDAVLKVLNDVTFGAKSKADAQIMLASELERIESAANAVLDEQGITDRARVSLAQEEFPTRYYDTFTLPAGVYDSLRVTIGEGEGHNWWCVVFPSLCIPAASDDVADTAAGAGFSDSLSGAITGEPEYEVRFFLLDVLGQLENFFHKG